MNQGTQPCPPPEDAETLRVQRASALRRAQQITAKYKKPGESVVAQVIAERREEAALLDILALGEQDIWSGRVKPVAEVLARLRGK